MTLWLLTARWCTVAGHLTILQLCSWSRQWYDYVHKVFCCCFCWSEPWAALCCAVLLLWSCVGHNSTTAPAAAGCEVPIHGHRLSSHGPALHTSRYQHVILVPVSVLSPCHGHELYNCHSSPVWAPAAVCSSNLTQQWAVRSLVLEPSEHSLLWTDYKSFVWIIWSNILVTVSTLSQWRRGSWGPSSIVHNKLLHNYPTVKLWSC